MLFKAAIKHAVIEHNPMDMVFHTKHEREHGKALTKEEELKLLTETEGTPYQQMFAVALYTGLRPNEYKNAYIENGFIVANNSKRKNGKIELKKILYVEGLKDYVKIYTEDSARPILSLMSMKSMEELLPASRFMRVHRSYIVQKEKIRVIDRGRIVFDKTYIPVSDSYKQVFQAFLDKRS